MTSFEFVFSLLVILLGLGLGEVLSGLARVLKRPGLRLGWATGLLAVWVMGEMVAFWQIIWRTRDAMPDNIPTLNAGFVITGLYYFAAASVFPDELDGRESLDDHFMQMKAKVVGSILIAIALSFLFRALVLGASSWSFLSWFDWGIVAAIYALGTVVMVTRRQRLAIACLAVLVMPLDLIGLLLSSG